MTGGLEIKFSAVANEPINDAFVRSPNKNSGHQRSVGLLDGKSLKCWESDCPDTTGRGWGSFVFPPRSHLCVSFIIKLYTSTILSPVSRARELPHLRGIVGTSQLGSQLVRGVGGLGDTSPIPQTFGWSVTQEWSCGGLCS